MTKSAWPTCFGCGEENPIGLKLKNTYVGDRSHLEFIGTENHCGHPGMLHGGIIATLLDEATFYAVNNREEDVVTATLSVRYIKPAHIGHLLIVEAWLKESHDRILEVVAELRDADADNLLLARSEAQCMIVSLNKILAE